MSHFDPSTEVTLGRSRVGGTLFLYLTGPHSLTYSQAHIVMQATRFTSFFTYRYWFYPGSGTGEARVLRTNLKF